MYRFDFDPEQGVLSVRVEGIWTAETVERYRQDLLVQIVHARTGAGRLKLLVDARAAAVQMQETADRLKTLKRLVCGPGDRIAILVTSNLVKLQARQIVDGWGNAATFVSPVAARLWLNAHDLDYAQADRTARRAASARI